MASEKVAVVPDDSIAVAWGAGGGGSRQGSHGGGLGAGVLSRSVRELSGSLRANWGLLGGQDNPLARSSVSRREEVADDEEALRWAALENLPTYNRVRTSIFFNPATGSRKNVDVRLLTPVQRRQLLDNLLNATADENEQILQKMRNRLDK